MSETSAWGECAEWVGSGDRDMRKFLCHRLAPSAGTYGGESDTIPARWPREAMYDRLVAHDNLRERDGCGTLDVREHAGTNFVRVIFCLFMALECAGEP